MASIPFQFLKRTSLAWVLLACLLGTACGKPDPKTKIKQDIVVASGLPFGEADPFASRSGVGTNILELAYPALFHINSKGEILFGLAEKIEWNPNSPELRVLLKSKDADAVLKTFDRIKKLDNVHFLEGLANIQDIKKVSERELIFYLEKWDRQVLYSLTLVPIMNATDAQKTNQNFILTFHSDEKWVLNRDTQSPDLLRQLEFRAIPSPRLAIRELVAGNLDFVLLANSSDLSLLENLPDLEISEMRGSLFYMLLENHRQVRLNSINWLPLNRKVLDDIFNGGHIEGLEQKPAYPYLERIADGKEAKIKEDSPDKTIVRRLSFLGFQSRDRWLARLIKRNLEEAGWRIELQSLSPTDFQRVIFQQNDYDIVLLPVNVKDPIIATYVMFHTQEGSQNFNISGYSNPDFDTAIERARYAKDPAQANQYFEEALKLLFAKPPGLFLGWATTPLVYRKGCTGFNNNLAEFFASLKDVHCVVSVPN